MNKLKKYNKTCKLLMILGMFIQILMPAGGLFASAEEADNLNKETQQIENLNVQGEDLKEANQDSQLLEDDESLVNLLSEGRDLGSIFEFNFLKINNVDYTTGAEILVEDGTKVLLDYKWNTEGLEVQPGDFATVMVPNVFTVTGDFADKDLITDGIKVGTYSLISGVLRIDFDQGINTTGTISNGYVGFGASFEKNSFKENVINEVEFTESGKKELTIIMPPTTSVNSIDKKGMPDKGNDKDSLDPKNITWTVNVINDSKDAINDAFIQDNIPAGLLLDQDSVKLQPLVLGQDGSLNISGEEITPSIEYTDNNFKVTVGELGGYKGYRLTYTTEITDISQTQFTNEASLNYDTTKLDASATVSGIKRSDSIEKSGKPINSGNQIEWTIDINKSGLIIDNAKVEDILPEYTSLTPGSITVYKLVPRGDSFEEVKIDEEFSDFPINLGALNETDFRRIKFKTDIDYTSVNNGIYQSENEFINKATLKDGESILDSDSDLVTTKRASIITKSGRANINYDSKTITWTIDVNKANHQIDNAVVTDLLPAGLALDLNSIKLKAAGSNEDIFSSDKFSYDVNTRKLTYDLGFIDKQHTLTFKTDINDFVIKSFKNLGEINGVGVGDENTDDATVLPTQNSFSKKFDNIGGLGINYEDKTIAWKTEVNPILKPISKLKIIDTFTNRGLIMLPNTLEVKLGSDVLTEDDYTLSAKDGNYNLGFELEFKGARLPLNNKITITYKTSFDPNEIEFENISTGNHAIYKNKAQFIGQTTNGVDFDESRDDDVKISEVATNTGYKVGKLVNKDENDVLGNGWVSGKERQIEWTVYANYLEQNLQNPVSFSDTLGYEGEIDLASIELYTYTVNPNGDIVKGEKIEDGYTKTLKANSRGFDINFNADVVDAFMVIFRSSVPKISKAVYTNTATTTAQNHDYSYSGSVKFDKGNSHLSKTALNANDKEVYTDQELNWKISINESISIVESAISIKDTISSGQVYLEGSLKIYQFNNGEKAIANPDDYYFTKTKNAEGLEELKIVFNTEISHYYEIEYSTIITATSGKIYNDVTFSGKNTEEYTIDRVEYLASVFSYAGGDPSRGEIVIQKTDDNGNLITKHGAKFLLLYKVNPSDLDYKVYNDKTYETKMGEVVINNLPINRTYFIKEVEAPVGHLLNSELVEVVVSKSKNVKVYKEVVENKIIRGNIELVKKDNEKNALEGVLFRLTAKNNQDFEPITVFSNANGEVLFSNIPYGDYFIQEVSTLTGYIMDTAKIPVTISSNNETIELDPVVNTKIRGNIEFTKIDNENNPVKGAEFGIYLVSAPYVQLKTSLSEADGRVRFENLEYGDYIIKEERAAAGYIGSDAIIEVSVKEHADTENLGRIVNTKIRGSVSFVKKDNEGNKLGGAQFKIYKATDTNFDNPIKTTLSDSDTGLVKFDDLEYGSYVINETKAPEGYLLTDGSAGIQVDIVRNKVEIKLSQVENTRVRASVQFIKNDNEDNVVSGAEFAIYNSDDLNFENALATQVSDANGLVKFENLAYGDYKLKEVSAPEGYIMSDAVVNVSVRNKDHQQTIELAKQINTKIRGSVEIIKKDSETNLLQGARFEMYDALDEELINPLHSATSNIDGIVSFEDIAYGDYIIKEVEAPEGYLISENLLEVSIKDHGVLIELPVQINTRVRADIEFIKKDSDKKVLPDAVFEIYKAEDSNLLNPIQRQTSNEDGLVRFEEIPFGSYKVKEILTPEGHLLSTEILSVEVGENDNNAVIRLEGFVNTIIRGDIELLKTNQHNDALANAEFTLYDKTGSTALLTASSNEDGLVVFKGVAYGTYIIKETKAPTNHVMSETEYTVSIEQHGVVVKMDIEENALTSINTYVSPKTDITATKTWINGPTTRPDIQLQLFRDGKKYLEPVTLKSNTETYTWSDLDLTDSKANKYTYTVKEISVPENYKVSYGARLTVINTYVSPKIDVTGSKVWIGGPEVKPTIQLQLYRNDKAYLDPATLIDGMLAYTWKDVDAKDENGIDYTYTVKEVKVPKDYDIAESENKLTVTNIHFSAAPGYDPEKTPPTGIDNNQLFYLSTLAIGGLGLVVLKKRKTVI